MATRADVIRVAQSQVGVKESPAGSNHQKYGEWYGMDRVAWCAEFVSWVMHHAGIDLRITTPKGYAYCPSGVDWFKARGLWRNSRLSQPGDPVFFSFNGGSVAEHTGIILKNNPLSGTVTTIEGNTGITSDANGGEVMVRERARSLILGTGNIGKFISAPPPPPKWATDGHHHPVLKEGSRDEDPVKHLQRLLLKHGANIVIDGEFGHQTLIAVGKFQDHRNLRVDGEVGTHTWEELHR